MSHPNQTAHRGPLTPPIAKPQVKPKPAALPSVRNQPPSKAVAPAGTRTTGAAAPATAVRLPRLSSASRCG